MTFQRIPINPKADAATIGRADKKAAEQVANYTILGTFDDDDDLTMILQNEKNGIRYTVVANDPFDECAACNCPAYRNDNDCKHCSLMAEEVNLWNQCEVYEANDAICFC